ncbi:MAG: DUF5050 domain-containing protein [Candidatus Aenigmatarchaeota archaeon]
MKKLLLLVLLLLPIVQANFIIGFASERDGDLEIHTIYPDGSNLRQLTFNSVTDKNPMFSFDGNLMTFDSKRDGQSEIYIMNADGSNQRRLTFNDAIDWDPAFSPDGSKIVFTSSRRTGHDSNIFIMNADGSNQRSLTWDDYDNADPSFTPDGRIVFHSNRDGNYEIYIMNQDGSGLRRLTYSTAKDLLPSVSRDGRKILFTSDRDGDNEIYVMNIDGSGVRQLTFNNVDDRDAVFSPDGNSIVFTREVDGQRELWVMNADGSNQRRLTFSNGIDGFPTTAAVILPPTTTVIQQGTLKVFKFYDSNSNGVWDQGEQPLSGFSFTVQGPISATVYTNADGYALLSNIPYGTYTITENVPSGWVATTPVSQSVSLSSPSLVEVRFGNKQVPTTCYDCYAKEELSIGTLYSSAYSICRDKDARVEFSIPVKLVSGRDGTEVTARFYIEEDGKYVYIGRDQKIMDVGQRSTFRIDYDYNAYDLSLGTHYVKVIVQDGDKETRYTTLKVVKCDYPKDLNVGFISLYPENPKQSDLVQATVPITLKDAPSLPQTIYVQVKIDGKYLTETSMRFYHIETKDYKFYFNADQYGQGQHTIQVTAWFDDVSDTSSRQFIIGETSYFKTSPEHCLIVQDFWTDNPLKEEQPATIKARIRNCGLQTETNIESRLYMLNKTFTSGIISLRPNEERDVSFTVRIPEDTGGVVNAKINVWNPYASDKVEKNFAVLIGYPQVRVEKDYYVRQCTQKNISFIVKNVGQVRDNFVINIDGDVAKWMTYPKVVELDAEESKRIYVDVNVPCDAKIGSYQFTVSAQGSPKYSATSTLHVLGKPISITGWLTSIDFSKILPWLWILLLLLLIPLLILLLIWFFGRCKRRNKKPERCMGPHGC